MKKKSLLITAIAIFGFAIVSMAQTVPSYVPTSGLVGWWPFNGNANDESLNGNNGSVTGALLTSDRNSNLNSAYSFDGNGDFINCGNSPTVNITGSVSISAWIYASNLSGDHGIISKMNTGIATYELITGGNLFRWMDVGGFLFSNSINPNQWIHVVSVFDSSLLLKSIYINGVLDTTRSSLVTTIPTNSDNLYIGAHQPSIVPGWSWDGKLDDIGIWNRALDSCEIKDLYFARPGSCCHISVSTQPTNSTTTISNAAQFTIASSDSSATYQWQSDLGVGFQNINSVGQYSGTNKDTLRVANVTMGNNNQPFRCIIRSGSCYDTSDIAILNVCGAVTISPANQNVVINNTAEFTTASTDPMATYQWQSDLGVGFQNINSVGQYSGTNKDTLRVANVTMGNNNQPFRCIVSSGACSDTSTAAVLTVINANGINETSANNLFTVYPNPAKSQINVKADATLIGASYTVYNNIGEVTLTGKINAENTVLDLGHLSSGVYLFSIGDHLKQRFTVVKE